MKKTEKQSFEQRLEALEAIIRSLETGGVPLEEALKRYEEGSGLAAALEQELAAAEQRLTVLRGTESGELREEPLTLTDEA